MPPISRVWLRAFGAFVAIGAHAAAQACTISATSVAFGTYDTISAVDDVGTGTITVVCHPSVNSPVVHIEGGSSGSIQSRQMRNGATSLDYNLYTDASRLILWGNGAVGAAVTLSGGNSAGGQRRFDRTIYGRIPARQNVGTGVYSDTLVITVIF